MKEGTKEKLKFKKLKHQLRLPEFQVVGILESIWMLGRTSAQEGNVGKYSNEEIAVFIEYHGDADELIEALVDCRWLDKDDQFRLVIHNWERHVPNYLRGAMKRHDKVFADEVIRARDQMPNVDSDDRPEDEVRTFVLTRDKGICQYCLGEAQTIDHVVPKYRGGSHGPENLVA